VIKISGSVFYWNRVQDALPPLLDVVKGFVDKQFASFCLVAGGGEPARQFINVGRSFGANEGILDDLGLRAAQLNAELVVAYLKTYSCPIVPKSIDETVSMFSSNRVVAVGGFHPGHSTNAVGALLSERLGADLFINMTDVDAVYSSDPNKEPKAKKLSRISAKRLRNLVQVGGKMLAGSYELMDVVAINIIERSRINTRIIKCDPSSLDKAIRGESIGTRIMV
jgi:uridylate kinase